MMRRYALVAFLLASTVPTECFQSARRLQISRAWFLTTTRRSVSAAAMEDFPPNERSNIKTAMTNVTQSLASAVVALDNNDDDDAFDSDQEEIDSLQRKKQQRAKTGSYRVTLPFIKGQQRNSNTAAVEAARQQLLGVSICQVDTVTRSGTASISDVELDLDSLQFQDPLLLLQQLHQQQKQNAEVDRERINPTTVLASLEPNFRGLVVSSVLPDSLAWKEGVRPGDVLVAVSATLGDSLWPKSTLEGVQSAISSRRNVAASVQLEFRRRLVAGEQVDNRFELTLTRPIGLVVKETEDGYVEVAGFKDNAPTLVKYAVKVGDRILAVDSSLGDQMWPVSTVEGVISACTSRLPGQSIKMRFERPLANMASSQMDTMDAALSSTKAAPAVVDSTPTPVDKKELLSRCRDLLRRYGNKDIDLTASFRFKDRYTLPAIVADKVVDALASASAVVDSVTLSMIMRAYLSCGQPEGATKIFETATGFSADGSSRMPTSVIKGTDGKEITPNESALNLYTGTALLQAHAMKGDIGSVSRVLAAVEGRSGEQINGLESAPWPWTGTYGSIKVDTQCYNIAIAAAEKVGGTEALDFALELFSRMADASNSGAYNKGPVKDVVTYNTLVSALSNAGRAKEAFSVFDKMKRDGARADKYAYTSLIKACDTTDDIQELMYDMREHGVKSDVVTYNTMIKLLCEAKKWTQATKLVTEMESRGVSPDSMTYGYLMNAMVKSGKPHACLTLFESAFLNGRTTALTENVFLYTTAITAASMIGDHERALEFVSRMNAIGVKPNLKTLTAVMGACLSSGKADLAAKIFERIDKPDGYAITQGIRALCENGDLSAASDLLEKHSCGGKGVMSGKETMLSYSTIIKCALAQKDYDAARSTISDLFMRGYIPSKAIIASILEAMTSIGDGGNVEAQAAHNQAMFGFSLFVIDSLRKRNLPVDSSLYAATLFLGNRLGGLHRKISATLVRAKNAANVGAVGAKQILSSNEKSDNANPFCGWEETLLRFDSYRDFLSGDELPTLPVRVAPRDIRRVLKAEQIVGHNSRRRARRRRQLPLNS